MDPSPESPLSTRPRMVLLGASNVALGLPTIVSVAWGVLGRPIEIFGALGHGRSYGVVCSVLGRSLCGILQSRLWEALREAPAGPTYALVTDVGNDVGYGVEPERIASWVEECLQRLEALGARTVLTLLPLESLAALSRIRYAAFRALLFPSCRLRLSEALGRSRELDSRLREVAVRRGTSTVTPEAGWYGLDPIHIRRQRRTDAWGRFLAAWKGTSDPEPERGMRDERGRAKVCAGVPLSLAIRIWRLRPEAWRFLGRDLGIPQPSKPFPDGTRFWLY